MRLAIFATLSRELKYLIKGLGPLKKVEGAPCPVFKAGAACGEVVVAQTGMGIHRAESALDYALNALPPDYILSIGFGGALYEGACAGDLILAANYFFLGGPDDTTVTASSADDAVIHKMPPAESPDVSVSLPSLVRVQRGCIVTLGRMMEKPEIMKRLPDGLSFPVCDMEAYVMMRMAAGRGLPFSAVRGITDTADEEIPARLLDVIDESGNERLSRVLIALLHEPGLVKDIIRLQRSSEAASKKLDSLVQSVIRDLAS